MPDHETRHDQVSQMYQDGQVRFDGRLFRVMMVQDDFGKGFGD